MRGGKWRQFERMSWGCGGGDEVKKNSFDFSKIGKERKESSQSNFRSLLQLRLHGGSWGGRGEGGAAADGSCQLWRATPLSSGGQDGVLRQTARGHHRRVGAHLPVAGGAEDGHRTGGRGRGGEHRGHRWDGDGGQRGRGIARGGQRWGVSRVGHRRAVQHLIEGVHKEGVPFGEGVGVLPAEGAKGGQRDGGLEGKKNGSLG